VQPIRLSLLFFSLLLLSGPALGAGTLTPRGSGDPAIAIRDHHAEVVIQNGFARTEVTQTFFNPADRDLEAIYSFRFRAVRACPS